MKWEGTNNSQKFEKLARFARLFGYWQKMCLAKARLFPDMISGSWVRSCKGVAAAQHSLQIGAVERPLLFSDSSRR